MSGHLSCQFFEGPGSGSGGPSPAQPAAEAVSQAEFLET